MEQLVMHFNNISANDKARDIYNLAYDDTEENRINFEKEIQKVVEDGDVLLIAALRSQYIQTFRISTSMKPLDWARTILIKHKILTQFDR